MKFQLVCWKFQLVCTPIPERCDWSVQTHWSEGAHVCLSPMTMSPTNQMMKVQGPGSLPVRTFLHVLNYPLIV